MIIVQVLELLFQTIWLTFSGIVSSLIKVLPEFFEIKEMFSSLTPTTTDIIAFCLGVPTAVVSVIIILVKVVKRSRV